MQNTTDKTKDWVIYELYNKVKKKKKKKKKIRNDVDISTVPEG